MSLENGNFSLNHSHLTNLVGSSNMVTISNQPPNQYVLAFQPNQWTESGLMVSSQEAEHSKVQTMNGYSTLQPQLVSPIEIQTASLNTSHPSPSSTNGSEIENCVHHTTQGQFFQPPFSSSDVNHSQALNSQLFTHVQPQYLLTSNRATFNLGSQISEMAYQTTPTATQLIIPSQNNSVNESQIASSSILPTLNSSLNQLVQVVTPNGQVMTTTMANLQGLGISTVPSENGPYTTYHYANNVGVYSACGQSSQPISAQLMTNSAGQILAVTPQIISGVSSQSNSIITDNLSSSTSQFIQLASPKTPLLSNQMCNTGSQTSSPDLNENWFQVQQLAKKNQHKSNQEFQKNKSNTSVTISRVKLPISSSIQNFHKKPDKVNQAVQVSLSFNPNLNQNLTSQSTVSSTTSLTLSKTNSYSLTKSNFNDSNKDVSNLVSVEIQTLSPSSHSNSGYSMEPESTTQNTGTVANTISNTDASIVDGVNLEEIKEFARQFKLRRLSLGLTQTQVGQALSTTEGPSYSQSAICRFEKLDITPKSAQKIKPVLESWMDQAEERYKNGSQNLTDFIGNESNKKRKRRTSFTPLALELLNTFFEKNTHPSGIEMTELADKLNYDREVVRVWFCNKRQALRNTMKKDISPHIILT